MKRMLLVLALAGAVTPVTAAARRRVVVHPPSLLPCTPGLVVADMLSNDLAVDATYVYFGDNDGGLFRAAKTGSGVTKLADIPNGNLLLLTSDDQNLYFFSDASDQGAFQSTLYSLPKSGGTPRQLADGIWLASDIRVDASSVYWISLGSTPDLENLNPDGKVEKINKDGTGRTLLASSLSGAQGLAVDDTNVWFGESGIAVGNTSSGLRRVPKNGGSITHVTDGAAIVSIALTPADVWFSTGDVKSSNGALLHVPIGGGTPVTVSSGDTTPIELHIAGSTVYYIASGDEIDTITSVPLAGGTPTSLQTADFFSEALAIDDCSIYFPGNEGIERIARP
jgi:hypothetical protein